MLKIRTHVGSCLTFTMRKVSLGFGLDCCREMMGGEHATIVDVAPPQNQRFRAFVTFRSVSLERPKKSNLNRARSSPRYARCIGLPLCSAAERQHHENNAHVARSISTYAYVQLNRGQLQTLLVSHIPYCNLPPPRLSSGT